MGKVGGKQMKKGGAIVQAWVLGVLMSCEWGGLSIRAVAAESSNTSSDGGGACSARSRPSVCGPSSFTFYLHNTVYNPVVNNTDYFNSVYSAVPPNVSLANPTFFGVTSTFEDPLTQGPANTSQRIGTAQGFYFFDSLRDFTLFHIFTANITQGEYTGTLDIFGQVREIDPVRYLTVIGGSGDFLLARGLATCRLVDIYRGPPGAARWTLSFDLDLYYF